MATTPKTTPRSTLSLAQLESHLWGAADILRGSSDSADKDWRHAKWSRGGRSGRDCWGRQPRSYGDLAFVQHMIASLAHDAMLRVVLPHGILFCCGRKWKVRQGMLEDDVVDAVIGLAPNLYGERVQEFRR